MYEYAAVVRSVHDGDTITVDLDLGFSIWRGGLTLRLLGINAPELGTVKVPGPGGEDATTFLMGLLGAEYGVRTHGYFGNFGYYTVTNGPRITVRTVLDAQEKYGRTLATLWTGDPNTTPSINDVMVSSGHAVPMAR